MKNLYTYQPEEQEYHEDWYRNRRDWIKIMMLSAVATQLPTLVSCSTNTQNKDNPSSFELLQDNDYFNLKEMQFLHTLQNVLVPDDGNGPSAEKVNAHHYYVWLIESGFHNSGDHKYFINKLKKLNQICIDKFDSSLHQLNIEKQHLFISNNIESGWTKSYISRMITICFEAILLDPVYGINTNEIGWKWLEHLSGQPQPNEQNMFPKNTKNLNLYV